MNASPADYLVCRRVMQAASRNYAFASRFLPASRLRHVEALYALMRVGDDRVDVSHDGYSSPLAAIEAWEQAYWAAFRNDASEDPVLRAYVDTAQRCDIAPEIMAPYFRAMKDDLTIQRFPAFADLLYYMEGSALPVGRAMVHILGVRPSCTLDEALLGADSLSIAMQLSNFWRDIGEDWRLGRLYIPLEDLNKFGVSEADIDARRVTPAFRRLMEFEIERTEDYYRRARCYVASLAEGRWAVMSGLEIYRAIITDIQDSDYEVFQRRCGAGSRKRVRLAAKARLMLIGLQPASPETSQVEVPANR